MAASKLKTLYIYDILQRYTDTEKGLTTAEIISHLKALGVDAERKSVYDSIDLLRYDYGADVVSIRENGRSEYRLASRKFELPELKLLVDAVQSSKFITRKKSGELIRKLESLTSEREAKGLQGQVFVRDRIKTMNETIYYAVDAVNESIVSGRKLTFCYFEWTPERKKRLKRDGGAYTVDPLALCWDDENYYLIANEDGKRRHFRVDKMTDIRCTGEPRDPEAEFDPAEYGGSVFGMFGGEATTVTLRCENRLAGVIIDKFGQDVLTVPDGDCFTVTLPVVVSPQFFGWLCGLSGGVRITSPAAVRAEFENYVKNILERSKEN